MTYPNGRVLNYHYAGVDNTISRLTAITDSTGMLEGYEYLGLFTVAIRSHSQINTNASLVKLASEPNSESADAYTGLDRFNRVIDQRWINTSTITSVDRYAYDRNGNRTFKENLLSSVNSELYAYDGMNRVTSTDRGTLNGTKTAIVGSPTRSQSWSLDSLGNSNSVTTDGAPETRTHNSQNELTALGSITTAYDSNGNLTTDQNGKTLVWDAWNRLVEVRSGSIIEATYRGEANRCHRPIVGTRCINVQSSCRIASEIVAQHLRVQVFRLARTIIHTHLAIQRNLGVALAEGHFANVN